MFNKVINSVYEILKEEAYTNIVVNKTIQSSNFDDAAKRLYTKLVYGVVENKLLIDYYLQPLITGQRVKPFIKNALRVGVFAIDWLNLANHYVVNEVVGVVKKKDYKASNFVNAILRKYINTKKRSLDNLSLTDYLSIKYSVSKELVELLYKQYPTHLEKILSSESSTFNIYRINTLKTEVSEIVAYLENSNISYTIEQNVILKTTASLISTNLFKEGKIVAQDASSIMVGLVASPKENMNILDACSAPGSKSMHLASIINNNGKITSCDIYEHKIKLIEDNAKKLGVTCVNTKLQDAATAIFDEQFDLILLDVPCSGLGVIKHKPDLKYQMSIEKIESIKKTQKDILKNTYKYLKTGGTLVYSTCTINKDENEKMIEWFLTEHPNFEKLEEYSILPSDSNDGFYICKLRG